MQQTFYYTATSSSEVLSFLASEGGPFGGPPFPLRLDMSITTNPFRNPRPWREVRSPDSCLPWESG